MTAIVTAIVTAAVPSRKVTAAAGGCGSSSRGAPAGRAAGPGCRCRAGPRRMTGRGPSHARGSPSLPPSVPPSHIFRAARTSKFIVSAHCSGFDILASESFSWLSISSYLKFPGRRRVAAQQQPRPGHGRRERQSLSAPSHGVPNAPSRCPQRRLRVWLGVPNAPGGFKLCLREFRESESCARTRAGARLSRALASSRGGRSAGTEP